MDRNELLQIAKPILFNTDMTVAIWLNRKTATRRKAVFLKGKNPNWTGYIQDGLMLYNGMNEPCIKPPRYKVGDYLYVRETWGVQAAKRYDAIARIMYRAGGPLTTICFPNGGTDSINRVDYDAFVRQWRLNRWYPSIHMPKEAARIFLRVTDVRLERLQESFSGMICPVLAIREEGVDIGKECSQCIENYGTPCCVDTVDEDGTNLYGGECGLLDENRNTFTELWNSTITKKDMDKYGWKANPWVWVIEFERVEVQG